MQTLTKPIFYWLLFIVGGALHAMDAETTFSYNGAHIVQKNVQAYDRLHIELNKKDGIEQFDRFGRVRTFTYRARFAGKFDDYKRELTRTLLRHVGYKAPVGASQRFFHLSGDPERWVYLSVQRDHYVVKYFTASSYPETVVLDSSVPYAYSARLRKLGWSVPANFLIPHIRDFIISDAQFKQRDRQRFEVDGKSRMVEGRTWSLKYEWHGQQRDAVRRYAMLHQYRDLVTAAGAQLLFEDQTHILFRHSDAKATTWGIFGGNDFAASLLLVEESKADAAEILDVNALKKALDEQGHVALKGIFFDTGKATLRPSSDAALGAASGLLLRFPDMHLTIEGHTDNVGDPQMNQQLSLQRALAVKNALVDAGIAAQRLSTVGYGETKPVSTNDTEAGRALNRRVELRHSSAVSRQTEIDAAFFRPLGDAVLVDKRFETYDTFKVTFAPPYAAQKKTVIVKGNSSAVRYVLLKEGKRDRSVSAYAIMEALKKNIEVLGGEMIAGSDDDALFVIRGNKESKDVYGSIETAMGGYRIYTIRADEIRELKAKADTKSKEKNGMIE